MRRADGLARFGGPHHRLACGPGMVAIVFWGKNRTEKISLTDRIANRVRGAEGAKA